VNRFAQLVRIGNCAMGVAGLLIGAFVAVGVSITGYWLELLVASGIVFTFIAAGNSLNDYTDREVDRRAHPERPIPSGKLSEMAVLRISSILFTVSLGLSLLLDFLSILIVASAIAVMLLYELRLKREGLSGNLSIAWLTGALFLLGGAVVDGIEMTLAIAAMAFFATLGREIVKDIEDMESDFDRNTLPKRVGRRKAGLAGSAAFVVAVGMSFQPVLMGFFGLGYLPIVLVADGIFIYCSIVHFRNPRNGQRWAKIGMMVALIAFLVGGIQ